MISVFDFASKKDQAVKDDNAALVQRHGSSDARGAMLRPQ
jgi:hypothetical protein